MIKLFSIFVAIVMLFTTFDAEAKRMGGGKSTGRQSSNVTQRDAAQTPAAGNQATAGAAAAGGAAAAAKKPWGAMLGGLAAGLGLAWLASSLGLGEGFANMLMIALLAMAAFAIFRMIKNRSAAAKSGGLAYQGAGAVGSPNTYNPKNVGNDSAARPWENQGMQFSGQQPAAAAGGSMIGSGLADGSALAGSQAWGVPADFDTEGFLNSAKGNFVTMQSAWDKAELGSLRNMMTDSMFGEIQSQLAEREHGHTNHTDVVTLDAQLLGIEELADEYVASVEFNGMIREDGGAPTAFREVWNMTKRKSGGGWLVAGLQALH